MSDQVGKFVTAIIQLKPFPHESFANRLHNKAKKCETAWPFEGRLPNKPEFGNDPWSTLIDGVDVKKYLSLLGQQAAVDSLGRLEADADKFNLRNCVNKSKTKDVANTVFSTLSTGLFAEHVNMQLADHQLPSLKELSKDTSFRANLFARMVDPHFVLNVLRTDDLSGSGPNASSAFMFVYEYLHVGPELQPRIDASFAKTPGAELLKQWSATLSGPQELEQLGQLRSGESFSFAEFIASATSHIHHITNDSGVVEPQSLETHVKAMAGMGFIPPQLQKVSERARSMWTTNLHLLKAAWGNLREDWDQAVLGAVQNIDSSIVMDVTDQYDQPWKRPSHQIIVPEGPVLEPMPSRYKDTYWKKITQTGQMVAFWINQGFSPDFPGLFTGTAPSVEKEEVYKTTEKVQGSCFVKGTLVATAEGKSIPIEEITEGTLILTDNISESYGVASDEDVVTPITIPLVCGINNGDPFFSPGHVFHTTAGLKAVNPGAARKENDWLEVGQLRVGHILYRMDAEKGGYELVPITSIEVTEPAAHQTHFYGVHLREGARSYHANGFRVHVNYPEITVKSIARQLSKFPRRQQMEMLYHIRELQPLFDRFGVAAMSEVLRLELKGLKRRKAASAVKPRRGPKRTSHLRRATRTYTLRETENIGMKGYHLPTMTIHEGVVVLDGQAIHRGVIDKDDLTIRWTRPVGDDGFEHGLVTMHDHGLGGTGVVVLTTDPDPSEMPRNARRLRFIVTKPNVSIDRPSVRLDHANLLETRRKQRRLFSRETDVAMAAEPLSGCASDASGIPSDMSGAGNPFSMSGEVTDLDYWTFDIDQEEWKDENPDKKTLSNPRGFGDIAFANYRTDGLGGLSVPIVTVPVLDQLLEDINKKSLKDMAAIENLYTSVFYLNDKGEQMGVVSLECAELLLSLADKPGDGSPLSYKNMTFKESLGSSVVLPILFQTMCLHVEGDLGSVSGAVLEFDPSRRGGEGTRYMMASKEELHTSSKTMLDTVRHVSASLAKSRPSPSLATDASVQPALITLALSDESALEVSELVHVKGYKTADLHSKTQTYIQNIMRYHMKDDQRINFIQYTRPNDLPFDLADDLPQDLKTWIRDVYSSAYISHMIAQTNDKADWKNPFTPAEKGKINFWWNGVSGKCLSQSPEYNKLNKIVTRVAMRTLYGTTLTKYLNDSQPGGGGVYWANALLKNITGNRHAMAAMARVPVAGGESILNRICNTLFALDPGGEQVSKLYDAVDNHAKARVFNSVYAPLDPAQAKADRLWLKDAMKWLVEKVLSNDPSLDSDLVKELRDEIQNAVDALKLAELKDAQLIAEEFATHMAEVLAEAAVAFAPVIDGIAAARKGWNRAKQVAADVVASAAPTKPWVRRAKAVMTVAFACLFTWQAVMALNEWEHLDGTQRVIAITETMTFVATIASQSLEVVKNFRDARPAPVEPVHEIQLTQMNRLTTESMESGHTIPQIEERVSGQSATERRMSKAEVAVGDSTYSQPAGSSMAENHVSELKRSPTMEEEASSYKKGDKKEPSHAPKSASKGYRWFTIAERLLRVITIALGIVLTIAISFDIANHWDSFNNLGKALNVVAVVTTGLAVLIDAAVFVADLVIAEATIAASRLLSTLSIAMPIIGAILALIGLLTLILVTALDTLDHPKPEPSPLEAFVKPMHETLKTWDAPPGLDFKYEHSNRSEPVGTPGVLDITVSNQSGKDQMLANTTFTLSTGPNPGNFFSSPSGQWTMSDSGDLQVENIGMAGVAPASSTSGRLVSVGKTATTWSHCVTVSGPKLDGTTRAGSLKIKNGESFIVRWRGIINTYSQCYLKVVEKKFNGNTTELVMSIRSV